MPKRRPAAKFKHIAFVASDVAEAQRARRLLVRRYGDARPEIADVIVALGGDGLMLATLQRFMNSGKPIYGMHRGTVGFLMNEYSENGLVERLTAAHVSVIHPLLMRARDAAGRVHRHRAINEVSLFRQTYQAARLRVLVDGKERLAELVADGIMLATPSPTMTRCVRSARSRSAWITASTCTCCSTPATASTSGSSPSNSDTENGRNALPAPAGDGRILNCALT